MAAINSFADGGTNVHVILEGWEEGRGRTVRRHPLPPPTLQKRALGCGQTIPVTPKPETQEIQPMNTGKKMFWKTFA
nr:hypothetical protein [Dictyobacter vulcani]